MIKHIVGIVGNGFVGQAHAFAFSPTNQVLVYDINSSKSSCSLEQVHRSDFVFVCVPTPMFEDGNQDISSLLNVFKHARPKPIYIIKSTILPGTTELIKKKFKRIKIIFSPEFITEKSYKFDILNQSRIIFGGETKYINVLKKLYLERFKKHNFIITDSRTAEFIKYMNNSFFATKVSVMNEFKLLSDKIGCNWLDALNGFASDDRIGRSHLNVPGPDGKIGYGGTCFPKDVCVLLEFAKTNKINLNTILGGWKTNLDIRPERDWEKKIGRTITKKINKT
tara:strand:- start:409 stop:1248 length:840 start_codon:yes stop_codon:yes gene_type:complete